MVLNPLRSRKISGSAPGGERLLQLAHERRPVEQPGQPVVAGLVGDLALGRLALADLADDAHRAQNGALVVGQHGHRGLDHELPAVQGPLGQLSVPVSLTRHNAGDLVDVGVPSRIEQIE
jgi:hypothetical protein